MVCAESSLLSCATASVSLALVGAAPRAATARRDDLAMWAEAGEGAHAIFRKMAGHVRAWVRLVEGRLVLTWQTQAGNEWRRGGTRPLTFSERLRWRIARRTPKP